MAGVPANRCGVCNVNWPRWAMEIEVSPDPRARVEYDRAVARKRRASKRVDFTACPICGSPTVRREKETPIGEAEAISTINRARFEEFYCEWDAGGRPGPNPEAEGRREGRQIAAFLRAIRTAHGVEDVL